MSEKPLHLVLKGIYFDDFVAGTKTVEFRRPSSRVNLTTCFAGRSIVLRRGYSAITLHGVIKRARLIHRRYAPEAARRIFPDEDRFIAIEIALSSKRPAIHRR